MKNLFGVADALIGDALSKHGHDMSMAETLDGIGSILGGHVDVEDIYPLLADLAPHDVRTIKDGSVLFTRPGNRPVRVVSSDPDSPRVVTYQGAQVGRTVLDWRQLEITVSPHVVIVNTQEDGEETWMLDQDGDNWDPVPPSRVANVVSTVLHQVEDNVYWHWFLATHLDEGELSS